MTVQWHFEEDHPSPDPPDPLPKPSRGWWWPLLLLLLTAVAVGGGWWWWQQQANTAVVEERRALQQTLDDTAAHIFSHDPTWPRTAPADPGWRVAQWQPHYRAFWQAQPTITNVTQPHPDSSARWLNVGWTAADGTQRQRVLFATQIGDQIYLQANDPAFWGTDLRASYPWGVLRFGEADEPLHPAVGEFVSDLCRAPTFCPPLTITLASDDAPATTAGEIRLPSPRLVGLDANGQPAPDFFDLLETAVLAYARPQPLRFAVPADQVRVFNSLAGRYNAQIDTAVAMVEIVSFDDLPPDPVDWLREVDGALFQPPPTLIRDGHIRDLTPLIQNSRTFDAADFYEQLWLAGEWQERLWMLPHTAVAPILYYDPTAYHTLNRPEPNTIWTWERLQADILAFYAQPEWEWGLVATQPELLAYGYAFTAGTTCPPPEPSVRCYPHLQPAERTAGQAFARDLAGAVPVLTDPNPFNRRIFFQNQVSSSTRKTPLWLDAPQFFEHHNQSRNALVAPWPGVVPLQVMGMVISQHTSHPTAVWHWLTHLSHQYPERTTRHIPARPSVARDVNFWRGLPSPLGRVMQASFPRARPIRLDEQAAFQLVEQD